MSWLVRPSGVAFGSASWSNEVDEAIPRASVIQEVCVMLASGAPLDAAAFLQANYPAAEAQTKRRAWRYPQLVAIFRRDGYTDRYYGDRLVFPGTLRAISILLPAAFRYHPNWKQSETHPAYWELSPTIDHVVPVARGGAELDPTNIVTTSMLNNARKANWTLEELGWPGQFAPVADGWDGLVGWFEKAFDSNELLRADPALTRWRVALARPASLEDLGAAR